MSGLERGGVAGGGVPTVGALWSLRPMATRMVRVHPPLFWTACALLLATVPTLLLMLLDPRQLLGVSVWVKPWKFQLSTGTYLLTLAWVLIWLSPRQRHSWAARYVAWVAIASAIFEVAYISWQAAWGKASHFNVATPLDATMYALMGVGAVLLTSTALVLGVMVLRSRPAGLSTALHVAMGWGLLMTFVLGTTFGAYMSSQTGHSVGGNGLDSGGMLLTGWSRSGGDLRVAHFFGVHAVHAMLIFGWLVDRFSRSAAPRETEVAVRSRTPVLWVWALGVGYALVSVWTFVQAMGGRPFLVVD